MDGGTRQRSGLMACAVAICRLCQWQSNFPHFGQSKIPQVVGPVISRQFDRFLSVLVDVLAVSVAGRDR